MTEVLFILTTIYVAYVIYKIVDNSKVETRDTKPETVATIITPSGSIPVTEDAAAPIAEAGSVAEEQVKPVKTAPVSKNELRHPETGETAKVTNNYRGLKRWLKEALVTEGLLDKVYANNELNAENNAKIKRALNTIKTLSKYHA